MTDFGGAFKRGQVVAKEAASARAEVRSLFQTLASQVLDGTDGVLELRLGPDKIAQALATANRMFSNDGSVDDRVPEWLFARNLLVDARPAARVARFFMPAEGFPCVLTYAGKEIRCHDAEALSHELENMLQDAAVARKLNDLLAPAVDDNTAGPPALPAPPVSDEG